MINGEASVASISQQPIKRKRNQPGRPDPGAEVMALSPRTLMATNRFVCDVCNKGFQRDQNLQLHRRGHNLPWKLKQKPSEESVRRKVYICPEIECVHHDPSRALGDLTGIKKHFFRKHGEKKWKCEKCSKKYAVQSDWKAHSKICGTREYRCDCGTLFSRRDSFITHRAFCDGLAQENRGSISKSSVVHYGWNYMEHKNVILKQEIPPWLSCSPIIGVGLGPPPPLIDLTTTPSLILQDFHESDHHNTNPNPSWSSLGATTLPPSYHHPPPQISATALLQKASQMGAKSSTQQFSFANTGHSLTYGGIGPSRHDQLLHSFTSSAAAAPSPLPHEMMVMNNAVLGFDQMVNSHPSFHANGGLVSSRSGNEGESLTRDFLGLRPLSQNDILSMTGLHSCINSNEDENQTPKSWQG